MGSLALRLTSSPSRAPTMRLPASPPSWLHGERASAMVSTFQLTRSTRLILTHQKCANIAQDLDERGRRRWAASEAYSLGRGGITAVAAATGISDRTIRNGIRELNDPNPLPPTRRRRLGGGRKSRTDEQPGLVAALEKLVDSDSRGDPQSPLRWTCKSTRALARALKAGGFAVSRTKVGQLLKSSGFSLQSNRKTREGADHPDRNAQFEHIAKRVKARQRRGEPALSVDTKKKEVLGNLKNPGKTYRRKRKPVKVNVHDFPDPELGKQTRLFSSASR